jgi:quercetin dioxygenase-like cupin family protein
MNHHAIAQDDQQHTASGHGTLAHGYLVRHATSEKLQDGPTSVIELLADGEHSGGALTVNRARLEVSSPGAPSHRHQRTTETIFVIDGSLDVLVGEEVHVLVTGDLVVLPPGVPHAFAPTAGGSADMLAVFSPGQRRFEYYRLLERLHRGEATVDELTATADLYDNHYVASDTWDRAHPREW